ncbi:MAG: DUF896 domain-containing protein [Alkaliphilus sp.]
MLNKGKINRINELSKQSKSRKLTKIEKKEQDKLRKEYILSFRKSFTDQLESIEIVDCCL